MKEKAVFMTIILLLFLPAVTKLTHAQDGPGTIIVKPPSDPNKDTDGDGLPDTQDKCPNKAGPRTNGGCPEGDGNSDNDRPSDDDNSSRPDDPNPDSDGDGLSDKDDQCPAVGGPTWNAGCPEDRPDTDEVPPTAPDPNDPPPPFEPPALPDDACYVTPRVNNIINVRKAPNLGADIVGFLNPSVVYEAQGVVTVGTETWYGLITYEGSTGTVGYAAGIVVLSTTDCAIIPIPGDGSSPDPVDDYELPPSAPPVLCHMTLGFDASIWGQSPVIESELWAGLYFESAPGDPIVAGTQPWGVISLERWIPAGAPDNAAAFATNVSVYEQAISQINVGGGGAFGYPTLEGGVSFDGHLVYRLVGDVEKLGACGPIIGGPDDFAIDVNTNDDTSRPPQTNEVGNLSNGNAGDGEVFEYCIYQEVSEAGVFEEVCYEIVIPDGCVLTTSEAGVYTLDCEDDDSVSINPLLDGQPADMQSPDADNGNAIPDRNGEVFEYCIYQEVSEAGVFEEVCYEIVIPDGCVLTTSEAGVYTLDCEDDDSVSINPLLDGQPADMQSPDADDQIVIFENDGQVFEYCIYQEVQEVGVFEEVCYEIEIPEGCVLNTSEAGVYIIDCGDGETVSLNPLLDGLPVPQMQSPDRDDGIPIGISLRYVFQTGNDCNNNGIDDLDEFFPPDCIGDLTSDNTDTASGVYFDYAINALSICTPGQIWQVLPSRPNDPICINPIDDLLGTDRPKDGSILVGIVPEDGATQAQVPLPVWEDLLASYCYPQNWWSTVDDDGNVSGGCWSDDDADQTEGSQIGLVMRETDTGVPTGPQQIMSESDNVESNEVTPEELCPGGIAFFTWLEDDEGNVIEGSADIECVPPDFFD